LYWHNYSATEAQQRLFLLIFGYNNQGKQIIQVLNTMILRVLQKYFQQAYILLYKE